MFQQRLLPCVIRNARRIDPNSERAREFGVISRRVNGYYCNNAVDESSNPEVLTNHQILRKRGLNEETVQQRRQLDLNNLSTYSNFMAFQQGWA